MLPTPPRLPCADELDEYIDDHAAEFVVYEPGGDGKGKYFLNIILY